MCDSGIFLSILTIRSIDSLHTMTKPNIAQSANTLDMNKKFAVNECKNYSCKFKAGGERFQSW